MSWKKQYQFFFIIFIKKELILHGDYINIIRGYYVLFGATASILEKPSFLNEKIPSVRYSPLG